MKVFVTASLTFRSINGVKFDDRICAKWLEISGRRRSFSISLGRLCCFVTISAVPHKAMDRTNLTDEITQPTSELLVESHFHLTSGNFIFEGRKDRILDFGFYSHFDHARGVSRELRRDKLENFFLASKVRSLLIISVLFQSSF